MSSIFDVIVVGSYTIDFIFSGMSEFPQPGKDIICRSFHITPGEAFIPAVTMHRLGLRVGWAADFGNDEYSNLALKCAREEGLDETLFTIHDRPFRRISVAASSPQERGFLTYYDPDPPIPAAMTAIAKYQAKVIFIPGLYSGSFLDAGIRLIRLRKMKVVMDGNSSEGDIIGKTRQCKAIRKSISSVDIFLPNAQEARRLTYENDLEIAAKKLGELCPLVVIKDGANGSLAYINQSIIHVPGIQIEPVDTTGAGDNFNAGFLFAWLNDQSVETCMKWGNIAGGMSTTELGGTTRKITADIVKDVLTREYPITGQNVSSLI